ncbi:hypothetical protein IQ06DRAFT_378084 [Phaeosphaeriaceae sp. SRC1lsM3a]|nr:hypothetical protein IQ06DRAFT_378084 [Stagonospora sp. SRC1lsM3a]
MTTQHYPPEYLAEDISGKLLSAAITMAVLDTTVIALMYASRWCAKGERKGMGMEIFMTISYCVCLGKITVAILQVKLGGAGRHYVTVPAEARARALKLSMASQVVCPLTTSFAKLGVLCLIERIFAKSGRWYKPVIRATFALVVAIMIVQFVIPFVNCRPLSKTWNPQGPGTCSIPILALWRYFGIPNMFATFIIVAIPAPALVRLNISRPMRFGLAAIFCVCVVGVVAAVMRVRSYLVVKDFRDITFENVVPMCWTVSESGIYLLAGVMPTLKPLLKKIFKGTALERLLTKGSSSRSWESRRLSRKWYQKEPQAAAELMTNKQRSLSIATEDEDNMKKTPMPRTHVADGRWV